MSKKCGGGGGGGQLPPLPPFFSYTTGTSRQQEGIASGVLATGTFILV